MELGECVVLEEGEVCGAGFGGWEEEAEMGGKGDIAREVWEVKVDCGGAEGGFEEGDVVGEG